MNTCIRRSAWAVPFLFLAAACGRDIPGPEPASLPVAAVARLDPVPELAYIGHMGAPFVSVVDVATMTKVAEIPVGASVAPNITVAPGGQYAYVVTQGLPALKKVDLSTNSVVGSVDLVPGTSPTDVAVTPNGHRVFVTQFYGHFVAAIDATTMSVLKIILLTDPNDYVNGIAMGPGGRHVFVSSQVSGRVHVIDTESLELVATVETGLLQVNELAVTQDGRFVLGTASTDGVVVVIDARTLAVTSTIPTAAGPNGIAIPSSGREAYVVHFGSNLLTVIDTRSLTVTATITVPGGPRRIGVSTNGRLAMVTNDASGQATLVDVVNRVVLATANIGLRPWGVTFLNGPQRNGEPVEWSAMVLPCPDGVKRPQLQSIFPLDERGNLVIVGRSPGCPGAEDYLVFDLSSGAPVMLDAIATHAPGYNLKVHSPPGSEIGFGATGKQLVVYNQGFSLISIPCPGSCTATGVWAASPTDVWVVTGVPGSVGRILRYRNGSFTVEYAGGVVNDIWGFGGNPAAVYAVGDRILRRQRDGTWREVLSPAALPAACGGPLGRVHGSSPQDIWAVGFGGCIVHGDGTTWTEIPGPVNGSAFMGVWALDDRQVLVAGQGGVDLAQGLIALWSSADGGESWTQVRHPAFVGLPTVADAGYFDLAATRDGQHIYAPGINGTLALGTVHSWPFRGGPVSVAAGASRVASRGLGVLPEQ